MHELCSFVLKLTEESRAKASTGGNAPVFNFTVFPASFFPHFAEAVFEELSADIPEEAMIVEQKADQPLTVSLNGITNKPKSTFVSGQNLWEMSTFFSPKKNGEGIRIREQMQILDVGERSQDLAFGENLEFPDVEFPVDLSGIQCKNIPYICFELRKGKQASINYRFRPNPDTDPLIDCQNTDDLCKGKRH